MELTPPTLVIIKPGMHAKPKQREREREKTGRKLLGLVFRLQTNERMWGRTKENHGDADW